MSLSLFLYSWLHWDVGRTGGYARVIMEREITGKLFYLQCPTAADMCVSHIETRLRP